MTKSYCFLGLASPLALQLLRGQEAPLDSKASSIKFTGKPQKLGGSAQLSPSVPVIVTSAKILIQASAMTTHEDARDKNMMTWLQVNANPDIVFTLTKVQPFAGEPKLATEKSPAHFSIEGELMLHGKKHRLSSGSGSNSARPNATNANICLVGLTAPLHTAKRPKLSWVRAPNSDLTRPDSKPEESPRNVQRSWPLHISPVQSQNILGTRVAPAKRGGPFPPSLPILNWTNLTSSSSSLTLRT